MAVIVIINITISIITDTITLNSRANWLRQCIAISAAQVNVKLKPIRDQYGTTYELLMYQKGYPPKTALVLRKVPDT